LTTQLHIVAVGVNSQKTISPFGGMPATWVLSNNTRRKHEIIIPGTASALT